MSDFHTPVLLKEVIEGLKVARGRRYIDATIGGGGHSIEILKRGGIVLGIDVDQEAIDYTNDNFKFQISNFKYGRNLTLVRGNFRDIDKIARLKGFDKVWGILFDLGVSSHQLEDPSRGFSFQKSGPLDMRMDKSQNLVSKVTAADLANGLTKGELYELFTKLGEESNSWKFSQRIVRARQIKPIETTQDLVEALTIAGGKEIIRIKNMARIFQALRIAVNDELNAAKEALPKVLSLLEKNARLLVISFHSLEDRIVKRCFIEFEKSNMGEIVTRKPIVPSINEVLINPRCRSAKLRIFERK